MYKTDTLLTSKKEENSKIIVLHLASEYNIGSDSISIWVRNITGILFNSNFETSTEADQ